MDRKQRIYPLRRPLARLLPKTPTTPPIQCPPIVVTPSLKRHGPRPGTAYRIRRKHTRPVPTEKDARVGQPARPAAPSIFPIVNSPASPLFQERKKSLHEVLKAMDERWEQRVRDSAGHTWSEPRPRELELETVCDFYNKMHDENTMELTHCVVCYEQKASVDVSDWKWTVFEPLYRQAETRLTRQDREHFACRQCFPREGPDGFPVCQDCSHALEAGKLPRACQVNNLGLGCVHRYPAALRYLTPMEERLIGLYIPCGWITKFQIDIEKATNGRYRKHKKGHITVFPNDVENLVSKVLPHPMMDELERIHVCFVAPRKPVTTDIAWMMSVRPQRLKGALTWLKQYNPLFRDICISEENLRSWGDWCSGTEVPQAIFDSMVPYELSAEDQIRTGYYVSAVERGRAEQPIRTAEEVLAMLEDREDEDDAVRQENESNARLGGLQGRHLQREELDHRYIEEELIEMVSTGMLGLDETADHGPRERLRWVQASLDQTDGRHRGKKRRRSEGGIGYFAGTTEPFIINQRGEEYVDSNDPDFFPKTFPCLFPWGRGGPKLAEDAGVGFTDVHSSCGQDRNFTLRSWARLVLQRHGGLFATHPAFPFLIYNMLVRSENRRISYIRMQKRSFARVEQILRALTASEIEAAEGEYRQTRTTTNEDVSFLLRELSAFGHGQHMSNEERLGHRRKINSLSLLLGMKTIWFTLNPNDLTNEVNMKLTAYRAVSGELARQRVDQFRKHIGRVQHVVRDPVSSAKFFDREIRLFFQHCVRVGGPSIFGKVSGYYGCVETNERGAEHLHGFLWLDANVEMPTVLDDMQDDGAYAEQVCRYLDTLVSECCDERGAKRYRRWDSVFRDISDIVNDADKLADVFESEANWVAHRCQMHSCGATCVKYSFKEKGRTRNQYPCRFRAPWALREQTEFTPSGLLHVKRNHSRISRFNKALAVALRHNHDIRLLVTVIPTTTPAWRDGRAFTSIRCTGRSSGGGGVYKTQPDRRLVCERPRRRST